MTGETPDSFHRVRNELSRGSARSGWRSSRRDVQPLADRSVALVAAEKAIEDLPARVAHLVERVAYSHCVIELAEDVVGRGLVELGVGGSVAGDQAQPVDAEPAREHGEPGSDRVVASQLRQPLEGPGEDLLEHVFRVMLREAEAAAADRVHVARKALDELVPRLGVTRPATGHELRVCLLDRHLRGTIRLRNQISPEPGRERRRAAPRVHR